MTAHLQRRLLQDIAELQQQPYPRITLHTRDDDLKKACLVLQPEGWMPIHTTVEFRDRYPLVAPTIKMDTAMQHPNVFSSYICASILNTFEGYTPAYTLKGIAIQMLSFFNSESIEQSYGDVKYSLQHYRQQSLTMKQTFICKHCDFDGTKSKADVRRLRRYAVKAHPPSEGTMAADEEHRRQFALATLPDELLLAALENLDFEDLIAFSQAWPRVAKIITHYDLIRLRELQCFFSKTNFQNTKLGVGVAVSSNVGRSIESEFDFISQSAFQDLSIRLSVHNIRFQHWLPLPLSHRHWASVREDVAPAMRAIAGKAFISSSSPIDVLAAFMNAIVVRLNQVEAEQPSGRASHRDSYNIRTAQKSTLRHASEKAIESYFHLFHLLLCLATEDDRLIKTANAKIQSFKKGNTSKADCPNLGHLLVYLLISDVEITERLRKAIITEAITRNVVWMLDKNGANMPELSYLEPDKTSHYRLRKTFEASRTSYRLLMFSELFRRIARPSNGKTLVQIRDELFERHGAPPAGAALQLSTDVRRLHDINNFLDFFEEMGIEKKPSPEWFTSHLRECVRNSMVRGYSVWGMPATTALALRYQVEPTVGLWAEHFLKSPPGPSYFKSITFFPNKKQPQKAHLARR
ncbi:ubiquitin-conjugating enzyme family protein [Colletotrichum truncatum]|uniref:Ubiquitin-conjugating enzyme family protein n=1 Tax=Colletotrichum truncatum TaxID=5467 RepID=A0ACC3YUW6_COLTU|nr:ubiquitin-conjugating enzyme family protein [Colletotrichum truncatum]KAF6785893.1 ubiquitin-conjugating enzyme family protein [Colletotrichum truncatum]